MGHIDPVERKAHSLCQPLQLQNQHRRLHWILAYCGIFVKNN